MARDLLDDLIEVLKGATIEFVHIPQQPRARRVATKPPKAKKVKAPKPAKREAQGPTLYDVLQISKSADSEIVTAAWKAACRKHHPDTGHGNAKKMAEINAAYEILKEPVKRKAYDQSLRK